MLSLSILFIFLFVGANGTPIDFNEDEINDREYMFFPDGNGNLHLIHLKEDQYEPTLKFSVANHVHFLLFTRKNPEKSQELIFDNVTSIINSNFDPQKNTIVIAHGWSSDATSPVNELIRKVRVVVAQKKLEFGHGQKPTVLPV
uniref:Putative secreted protein n=1 Tax=Xenopsylla cheopis TaxID=163159 RepID=A0A6M2E3G0_XENCH